jgi:hypothetical protein
MCFIKIVSWSCGCEARPRVTARCRNYPSCAQTGLGQDPKHLESQVLQAEGQCPVHHQA